MSSSSSTEAGLQLLQLAVLRVQGLELFLSLTKTESKLAALVVQLLDPEDMVVGVSKMADGRKQDGGRCLECSLGNGR